MKKHAYVRLLDEGVEVRRPCAIWVLDESNCIILADYYDFGDPFEVWEFKPGQLATYQNKEGTLFLSQLKLVTRCVM